MFAALLEEEKQRIDSITAGWDDPSSIDWEGEKSEGHDVEPTTEVPSAEPIYKCTALYTYTVRAVKAN